jgi:hypothetical protein
MLKSPLLARVSSDTFQVALGCGGSRYSAIRAAELALEGACIEALRLPALFTLDQCCANRFDLGAPPMLSPDEITNVFAIVGVVASFDLRLDPFVLLVGQRMVLRTVAI